MPPSRTRITGGSARGVPLHEVPGRRTRPTSSRLREAIMNIISDRITGARVADLFAGSGALGLEAVSRGAAHATFVESDRRACTTILDNLGACGLLEQGTVVRGKLPGALPRESGPFDLVLLDPPYGVREAEETLAAVHEVLAPGGRVVFEHGSRYNPPEYPTGLTLEQTRTYGDSAISIYRQEE